MLNSDTFAALKKTIQDADPSKRIVHAPAEPKGVYYVVKADGEMERVIASGRPELTSPADLDSLVRMAISIDSSSTCEIWYSRRAIVAGEKPGDDTYATSTLELSPSPQLSTLMKWDANSRVILTQQELIILLRTTFADCWTGDHPNLLSAVRQVKTSKAANVDSQVNHGKVSLGKSVTAEMSGLAAIPEEIAFRVPAFAEATVPAGAKVRVAIDPDPASEKFTLIVLPGQIEHAQATGEDWIESRLMHLLGDNTKTIPLYRGKP